MYQGHRVGAILLMGGAGIRFGKTLPKQFVLLHHQSIYLYALTTFLETTLFDEIILVCHPQWIQKVASEVPSQVKIVAGKKSRQESSMTGLTAYCKTPHIALIHDAVRPFVKKSIILANLEAAIRWGAANTCIPNSDTLVFSPQHMMIESIPKREEFLRGQTPQTFLYDLILAAHNQAREDKISNATDDCCLVLNIGAPIAIVPGCESNLKITSTIDLKFAEALLASQNHSSIEPLPNET